MSDYQRGGHIPPAEPILIKLGEGEEVIDRHRRRRARVIRGRLIWFPPWLSKLLPRWRP